MNNEWITDRLPNDEDCIPGFYVVWNELGRPVHIVEIKEGAAWKPIPECEPYVKLEAEYAKLEAINAQLLEACKGLSRSAEQQNWLHVATNYARATIAKAGVREYEKNPKYAQRMVRWWDRYAGHISCESIDQLRAAIAKAKQSDDNYTTTTNGEQP